jgi:hypothetical protein
VLLACTARNNVLRDDMVEFGKSNRILEEMPNVVLRVLGVRGALSRSFPESSD